MARNTIILLLVFIILFSGCATVAVKDSGLLKEPCSEKLIINSILSNRYGYLQGEKSGAIVPVDHPDVKKLFSYDFSTAKAYDEYLAMNNVTNVFLIIASLSGLATITDCMIIFSRPSLDVELAALGLLLPSITITLGASGVGIIIGLITDGKRSEAFNLYGVSCKF